MKLYKVLAGNGTACHGGHGAWNLPHGKRPGKWMPTIRSINPRIRGYHLVSRDQLIYWLGPFGPGVHLANQPGLSEDVLTVLLDVLTPALRLEYGGARPKHELVARNAGGAPNTWVD